MTKEKINTPLGVPQKKADKTEKEVSSKGVATVEKKGKEVAPVVATKNVSKNEIKKREVVVARGIGLKVSPKQCVYICKIIRGKNPESAIARLQDVIDERLAVPMSGLEVGHRKGKGLAGGKFPKNACRAVMDIVKQAAANTIVAGIENPVIVIAKSDRASAPLRRGGRKAKRCHLYVEIRNREVKK